MNLFKTKFTIKKANWINTRPKANTRYQVQIRYQTKPTNCTIKYLAKNKYQVILIKTAKAVTPGQSAVIYNKQEMIGGGVIEDS